MPDSFLEGVVNCERSAGEGITGILGFGISVARSVSSLPDLSSKGAVWTVNKLSSTSVLILLSTGKYSALETESFSSYPPMTPLKDSLSLIHSLVSSGCPNKCRVLKSLIFSPILSCLKIVFRL